MKRFLLLMLVALTSNLAAAYSVGPNLRDGSLMLSREVNDPAIDAAVAKLPASIRDGITQIGVFNPKQKTYWLVSDGQLYIFDKEDVQHLKTDFNLSNIEVVMNTRNHVTFIFDGYLYDMSKKTLTKYRLGENRICDTGANGNQYLFTPDNKVYVLTDDGWGFTTLKVNFNDTFNCNLPAMKVNGVKTGYLTLPNGTRLVGDKLFGRP